MIKIQSRAICIRSLRRRAKLPNTLTTLPDHWITLEPMADVVFGQKVREAEKQHRLVEEQVGLCALAGCPVH